MVLKNNMKVDSQNSTPIVN